MKPLNTLLILATFAAMNVNAQQQWSLKECVEYALMHSHDLKIAELNIESRKLIYRDRIFEVMPGLNPSVTYNLNSGKAVDPNTNDIIERQFFSSGYSIGSGLSVFSGFRQYKRILFEKLNYEIEEDRMAQTKNELIYGIIDAYTDCLLSAGMVDIQQEQLNFSQKDNERTVTMIKLGRLAGTELYDSKARISRDEFLFIQYNNQHKKNLLRLYQLMNLPKDFTINIVMNEIGPVILNIPVVEDLYESALEHNPNISILEKQLLASRTTTGIIRGSFWPSVSFSAGWSTGFYETNTDNEGNVISFREQFDRNRHFYYGARLSIPIFNSLSRTHQFRQSRINEQIKTEVLDKNLSLLAHEIQEIIMQAEATLSENIAANNQLLRDMAAFEADEKKRDKGLISIMDYYESRNNLARSKIEVLRTELQIFLNEYTIQFYKTGSFNI